VSHAVMVQVRIAPDSDASHRHAVLSDALVPEAKALPGFVKALWLNDGVGTGTCVVVFDTEEDALSAVGALTPEGGPAVLGVAVCAVEAEA